MTLKERVRNAIATKIFEQQEFTAFDITKAIREDVGTTVEIKHQEVSDLLATEYKVGLPFYLRESRDVAQGKTAWVYYPDPVNPIPFTSELDVIEALDERDPQNPIGFMPPAGARDMSFNALGSSFPNGQLPEVIMGRTGKVYDQGDLGSSTACALASIVDQFGIPAEHAKGDPHRKAVQAVLGAFTMTNEDCETVLADIPKSTPVVTSTPFTATLFDEPVPFVAPSKEKMAAVIKAAADPDLEVPPMTPAIPVKLMPESELSTNAADKLAAIRAHYATK